ncbi:Ino eighty subunit 1 [Spathaspora sp. JA1]|nr:Ino eighty subunit 1 [Spathaspora sp. JA1]
MSYDPVHDTYVPNKPVNTEPSAPEESHRSGPLSISSLVDRSSTPVKEPAAAPAAAATAGDFHNVTSISSLVNNSEDEEEEDDDTDVNSSIISPEDSETLNNDSTTTKRKRKSHGNTNRFKHLKKPDGEPFWRKDISYDFLKYLFDDETACFTNSFPECTISNANNDPKISFSDLYVRSLVESNKCSRVLKERLIKDKEMGKSVAKVCLLVNAGRMNTTINFVPEMRSSLRTYHSIPSLQADPETGKSKQLQDTPRLKSILKAVCEGEENNLKFLHDMISSPPQKKPNTNVVQLIFLLSNSLHGIPYFGPDEPNNQLLEFFMNPKIHPKNKAQRFLWVMYTYLETSFAPEELAKNPFGGDTVPAIELIPEDQINEFDKDTEYEIAYSENMYQARLKCLADEDHVPVKKSKKRDLDDVETNSESSDLDEPVVAMKKKITIKTNKKKLKRTSQPNVSSPLSKNVINFTVIDKSDENHEENLAIPSHKNILNNIQFPIEGLSKIAMPTAPSARVPDVSESISHMIDVVNFTKPIVKEVRTSSKASTASFNKKTTILGNWIYRYFNYKKSIGNKLLGMEWEDIRYDLMHSVESYMNEQFGKSLNIDSHLPTTDANEEDETAEHQDEHGFAYFPRHDYNKSNEKNIFILQLITFCNEWFILKLKDQLQSGDIATDNKITFDLDNDQVLYT